jgi:hypothetical protein
LNTPPLELAGGFVSTLCLKATGRAAAVIKKTLRGRRKLRVSCELDSRHVVWWLKNASQPRNASK